MLMLCKMLNLSLIDKVSIAPPGVTCFKKKAQILAESRCTPLFNSPDAKAVSDRHKSVTRNVQVTGSWSLDSQGQGPFPSSSLSSSQQYFGIQ